MDRRTYIEGVGAAVATGALAGCTGNGGDDGSGNGNGGTDGERDESGDTTEYGILSTSVTDQPNDIGDFESLIVTIRGIWVKPAGGDDEPDDAEDAEDAEDADAVDGTASDKVELNGTDDVNETDEVSGADDVNSTDDVNGTEDVNGTDVEGTDDETADNENSDDEETETDEDEAVDEGSGRYYIEFEEPQDADLVQLQGNNTQLVDETELEVGEYQFLQLDVEETSGTLTNGEEAAVETPGNAPLQFKQAFEIRSEERTRFIADFAPFRRGNGRYLIRPVASGTRVLYGDEEADSGEDDSDTDGDGSDIEDNGTDDDTGESTANSSGTGGSGNGGPENGGPGNGNSGNAGSYDLSALEN